MLQRLTLVGYRASGKSTLGPLVARHLGWPFRDADAVLEGRLGMPIARFFAKHGESAFRAAESAALVDILKEAGPLVLATGGGAVLAVENRDLLRARGGKVVYLHASAELLQARLRRHAGDRPSLSGAGVAEEVPAILAKRAPLYQAIADHVIEADQAPGRW
jgi:shikimate kinase